MDGRGTELEDEARSFYEFQTEVAVRRCGLVYKDESRLVSCSPDWIIGEDGGGEVKCPGGGKHIGYWRDATIVGQYIPQVQGCLWVTGRDWWDFVSYYPRLPPLVVRVERDKAYIDMLENEVGAFVERMIFARQELLDAGAVSDVVAEKGMAA